MKHNAEGLLASNVLQPLKSGAEACPFADRETGVVYKLFPLHVNGGLGKTFEIGREEDQQGFVMDVRDAVLAETLEKLMILHDAGGHPTEIVGLDEKGDYLIAKQPLADSYGDIEADRETVLTRINVARDEALKLMRAVPCKARFKRPVWIIWVDERAWIMSDLHPGNVMMSAAGEPCIIDALLAPLPTTMILSDWLLKEAVMDAREWRNSGNRPVRKAFGDDDDL